MKSGAERALEHYCALNANCGRQNYDGGTESGESVKNKKRLQSDCYRKEQNQVGQKALVGQ